MYVVSQLCVVHRTITKEFGSNRKRKAQPKAVSGRSPMLARARR